MTILPVITPQQQMALAFRGYSKPERTTVEVLVGPKRAQVTRTRVWSNKVDGPRIQWIEMLGRDPIDAVQKLVDDLAR